jgi:hypothetical protein
MHFHNTGENIAIFRQSEGTDCPFIRKRLESKLRNEPEQIFPEFRKWYVSMPDFPIMDISPVWIIGLVKASS